MNNTNNLISGVYIVEKKWGLIWLKNKLKNINETVKDDKFYVMLLQHFDSDYIKKILEALSEEKKLIIDFDNEVVKVVDAKDISGENQQTENPDDDTGGSEPVISSDSKFIHILCDTSLTGTIIECDFKVLSEESQNVCFSGDLILYSESLRNVEIRYFFDDTEINFTPKISVNGYSTQHLSAFFIAESGEHNFKAVIDSDIAEQIQGRIIGQNIRLVESKPTTADDFIYFIENDTVKLIFYKGTETRIQIPSEIEGKPVTEIESTCFTNSNVKYAVIPETVEKIY